jgi:hypothetical protein
MANTITYDVTINTSSISGTTGSLDFNFNPGSLVTQSASVEILDFSSTGGALAGSPTLTGDASGALPGTVTLDNGTGFNDYFEGFTFGSTLTFEVTLSGPALTSPDGATSGSTFAFSMFSDAEGTTPTLTSDTTEGFAFTVDVNVNGTTTVTDFSSETSVVPLTSTVPEPNNIVLILAAILCAGAMRLRHVASQKARPTDHFSAA